MDNVLAFTAFIAGLSAANERAVEIIKKSIPWLDIKNTAPEGTPLPAANITAEIIGKDRKRELVVYLVTLASAFLIVWAASAAVDKSINIPIVKDLLKESLCWGWLLLALMISAGSKVWNPILEYLKAVKDGVKGKG